MAKACGVTVRALRYYDEIGLVPASERTRTGHRRYTDTDVRRLYRVRALHQLGLSLGEIGAVLNAPDDPTALRHLLVAQLADLDARAAAIAEQRSRVQALFEHVDEPGLLEPGQLLAVLETTVPIIDPTAFLTSRQRDALVRRRQALGDQAVEALKAESLGLLEQLRKLLRDGVPAGDTRVRELADRWQEIGTAVRGATSEDEHLNTALAAVWRDHRTVIDQGMADRVAWLAAGDLVAVVEYIEQARRLGGPEERTKHP